MTIIQLNKPIPTFDNDFVEQVTLLDTRNDVENKIYFVSVLVKNKIEIIGLYFGDDYENNLNFPINKTVTDIKRYYENNRGINNTPSINLENDWDLFNNLMLSDTYFLQAYNTVLNSSASIVATSIPASLVQVENGQTSMFIDLFNKLCMLANVANETRELWAGYAEQAQLPESFIQIIKGTNNEQT